MKREESSCIFLFLKKACAAQTGTRDVGDTIVVSTTVGTIKFTFPQLRTVKFGFSTDIKAELAPSTDTHEAGIGTRTASYQKV